MKLKVGDIANKVGGSYQARGKIVAAWVEEDRGERYVFRFDNPYGMLHIFNDKQLEKEVDDNKTSWRELITHHLESKGFSWRDVLSYTLTEEELDERFDEGFGVTEGKPFTLWTKELVLFPACYDGSEWVASVPRWSYGGPTAHVGGG